MKKNESTPNPFWERILKVYEYSGLSSIAAFAEQLGLNRAENLYQIQKGKNKISDNLAFIINEAYPIFSIAWIKFGDPSHEKQIPYYKDFSTDSINEKPDVVFSFLAEECGEAEFITKSIFKSMDAVIPYCSYIFLKSCRIEDMEFKKTYFIETIEGLRVMRTINRCKESCIIFLSTPDVVDDIIIAKDSIRALYEVCGYTHNNRDK